MTTYKHLLEEIVTTMKGMVQLSQDQQWRTPKILKNLTKWCAIYCVTNQHLMWKLRHYRKSNGLPLFHVSIQRSCGVQNRWSTRKIGTTFEIGKARENQGDIKTLHSAATRHLIWQSQVSIGAKLWWPS